MNRFFDGIGSFKTPAEQNDRSHQVEVLWNRERLLVDLPPPPATLRDLKAIISERTGIASTQMKLISHGFQMRDDSLSLERYHLYEPDEGWTSEIKPSGLFRPSAAKKKRPQRLVLIGSPDTEGRVTDRGTDQGVAESAAPSLARKESSKAAAATAPSYNETTPLDESETVKQIVKIRDEALKNQLPTIEALEAAALAMSSKKAAAATESLMQALLAFDSMTVKPDWHQARQWRKRAIHDVQKALDRLDAARVRQP